MNTQYIILKKNLLGFLFSLSICFASQAQIAAGYTEFTNMNQPSVKVYANGPTVVYRLDLSNQAKVYLDAIPSLWKTEDTLSILDLSLIENYPIDDPWKQRELVDFFGFINGKTEKLTKYISTSLFHTSQSSCGSLSGAISLLPFKTAFGIMNGDKQVQARIGQKRMLGVKENTALGYQQADITNINLYNPSYSLIQEDYSKSYLTTIFGSYDIGIIGYDPYAFITSSEKMNKRVLAAKNGNYVYFMISSSSDSPSMLANQLVGFGIAASKTILLDNGTSEDKMCTGDASLNYLTAYQTSFIRLEHGN